MCLWCIGTQQQIGMYLARVLCDWVHLEDGDKDDELLFRRLRAHFISLHQPGLQHKQQIDILMQPVRFIYNLL